VVDNVRIVYGVQSTGKGHLSRFLGLRPLFVRDGHELLVIVTGRDEPPPYFYNALQDVRHYRFQGLPMIEDGAGGISRRGTVKAFAGNLPELFESFWHAHNIISAFEPDLIVSDFDPITGSPFVAPGIRKVGIGNVATLSHPAAVRPPKVRMDRFNIGVIRKLHTSGLDVELGSHFYPLDATCLPPILRPEILAQPIRDLGHVVVYHAFHGLLPPIQEYAARHPERPIVVYGSETRPDDAPENLRFEEDADRFIDDLASCNAYVGTAGFQTISEATFFAKKIVVQPIAAQYEQLWNAAELVHHAMGRWYRGDLDDDLRQTVDPGLQERLAAWYRSGASLCYERILSHATLD
jgi:uncharacterized protein (TIGR00661 family)